MFAEIILFIGLVYLTRVVKNPFIIAFIYGASFFLLEFIIHGNLVLGIERGLVDFVAGVIYFWLLIRFEDKFFWWILLLIGFFVSIL